METDVFKHLAFILVADINQTENGKPFSMELQRRCPDTQIEIRCCAGEFTVEATVFTRGFAFKGKRKHLGNDTDTTALMFAGILKVVPRMYTVKRLALGKAQQRFSSVLVDEFTYCWIGINNLPLFVYDQQRVGHGIEEA